MLGGKQGSLRLNALDTELYHIYLHPAWLFYLHGEILVPDLAQVCRFRQFHLVL